MLDKKIKIEKKLDVTDLAGEKVMIDFESGKYFMIKGAGNDIWDLLEDGITANDIIKKLLTIYEVSEEKCTEQVKEFINKLVELEFISFKD